VLEASPSPNIRGKLAQGFASLESLDTNARVTLALRQSSVSGWGPEHRASTDRHLPRFNGQTAVEHAGMFGLVVVGIVTSGKQTCSCTSS
jgi:hypothetical protein